jgi:hypothetical protein
MTRKRNKNVDYDAMDSSGSEEQTGSAGGGSMKNVIESLERLSQPLPKLVAFDLE